jgi:hypothetical protein
MTTFPRALVRVQYAVYAVAAIHVVALALILTHRDVMTTAFAASHPGQDPNGAVWQSVLPHVVLAILLPLRARRLRSGRPRARVVLTVVLAIQILAHATLPMVLAELPGYGAQVIAVQAVSLVFEIAALVLLWSPAARRFFAPAARPEALVESGTRA